VQRDGWKPTSSSFLCSAHFEKKWFDRVGEVVCLREGAIPTIFSFPAPMKPEAVEQHSTCGSSSTDIVPGMAKWHDVQTCVV